MPLHLYKCALPVRDGLSVLSKGPIPTFHFQVSCHNMLSIYKIKTCYNLSFSKILTLQAHALVQEISQKHGRYRLFRQSANSSGEISSLIRRIKRTTWIIWKIPCISLACYWKDDKSFNTVVLCVQGSIGSPRAITMIPFGCGISLLLLFLLVDF